MNWAHARLSSDHAVWVGVDEMNLRKGHSCPIVFEDQIAKRVLLATPGKDASVRPAFAADLLRYNSSQKKI